MDKPAPEHGIYGIYGGIGHPSPGSQTGIGTQPEPCPVERIKHAIRMDRYLGAVREGVMAANMRGPKPVDPLYWRINDRLSVRCMRCRNWVSAPVRTWIVWNRLDDRITFMDMQRRLTCLRCGEREAKIDLQE